MCCLVLGGSTLQEALFEKADYGVEELVRNLPAQVALLSLQFQWTSHVEEALRGAKTDKTIMSRALKRFDQLMRELVQLTAKDDLSSNERTSLESLITVHVHQRDAFNELLVRSVQNMGNKVKREIQSQLVVVDQLA